MHGAHDHLHGACDSENRTPATARTVRATVHMARATVITPTLCARTCACERPAIMYCLGSLFMDTIHVHY